MTSKEYLKSLIRRAEVIRAKLEDIEKLRSLCTRITPSYSEFSGSGGINADAKFVKPMIRLIEYEQKLNTEMDEYIQEKKEIEVVIKNIPDIIQQRVLILRYFEGMSWDAIAECMNYSRRHITRVHGYALIAFDKAKKRCP